MDSKNPTRRDVIQAVAGAAAAGSLIACTTPDASTDAPARKADLMTEQPLHYKTLSEVAARIERGELTSVEVTEAQLQRIEALEPKLHSYITVMRDYALERAAAADAQSAEGAPRGALHGVPIAVKDLCHKTGFPTTAGHSFRRDHVATEDATVVERLEAAGAVLLGKLATTEGAMVGYHRDFGVPRNPWGDLDRWPGVSSGGSGVATAAGLCYASLGTDTGGSIRFPSAANGIVGLKPTWGRVSRRGVLDLGPTFDHIGPMVRSVRDAARVLGVIAGRDPEEPTSLPDVVPDYETDMERGVAGLRIGWDETYATQDVSPEVAAAVRGAVEQLAGLGAEIVEVTMPAIPDEEANAWSVLAAVEAAAVHEATYPSRADEYGEYFRAFLAGGHATSQIDFAKATFLRRNAAGRVAPVFQGIDLMLSPTLADESFRYDPEQAYGGIDAENGVLAGVPLSWFARSTRFVGIWDYNGYPTLSVPCGFSPDGIPLSLQFVGPPLSESALCRAGHAYEQANDVHLQHPDLS